MTTTSTTPRYPVRPAAPGPAIVLDLPKLWQAVRDRMESDGITEVKQLSEVTGVDRTSLGRIRRRAENGDIHQGQRGGVNVNAYLTLTAYAAGNVHRTGVYPDPDRTDQPAPFGTLSAWAQSEAAANAVIGPTNQE